MIKRRFYKLEHGDRDAPSESSSSSSDSELEAEASDSSDGEEEEDEEVNAEVIKKDEPGSSSSGYETEDSSAHEVNLDSSGLPTSDEDLAPQRDGMSLARSNILGQGITDLVDIQPNSEAEKDEKDSHNLSGCVVRHKSVFKCKLCPRIVCLSVDTINAHLKSKRHARSEKLLREGRLKVMLDTESKFEEETAPTVASAQTNQKQKSDQSMKKKRGFRGQKLRKKKREPTSFGDTGQSTNDHVKRRRKRND